MAKIDWEKERARLEGLYAAMSEGELQEVAGDADSLTDVARAALRAEMLRRGMEAPPEAKATVGPIENEPARPNPLMVGRYRDLPNASVAKSVLDSAGIESFLADENMVQLGWSNFVGGVKLMVREEDADTARKLLEQNVPEGEGQP